MIVVLVPVFDRPQNADPLVASLRETTDALIVFLISRKDGREARAVRMAQARYAGVEAEIVGWRQGHGDYAKKINHGIRITDEPWIFQAGDDIRFHPGWIDAALAAARDPTLRPQPRQGVLAPARVIGTNDLCNPRVMSGRHSVHNLVHRSYVEEHGTIDEPGKLLHEGYRHNFCDDELIATARRRGEFVFARKAVVEHLHPLHTKGEMDRTYRLGQAGFDVDRRLHAMRRRLWAGGARVSATTKEGRSPA